ncbi:RNA polymerase sigma factor [Paracidovorax valerianellae]|uniref:RNA polymerase sigma-70 factor, ECF subfamily n=1 Tax=Paracidovorax valerianellae TaxID=187868 RepID=A0A1G7EB60_9BURK|nr:sigma-70 family RNA polymerase sigma factor [Paracidovorax valerianellae]MDA8447405.1 sigma-70 family RNA polymerase sigma factor [Paracidovorax valerianellae]SDE60898.1 RNA polymerase sigma-70 factor, ECF subfamily [Paracidovorax valerianellae]
MRDLIHELVAHYGDLRRHLTYELRDPHHAADIAQSSFERVYAQAVGAGAAARRSAQPVPAPAPIESPRALLFRVARNLCIDEYRKRKVAQDWASQHARAEGHGAAPSTEYFAAQRQVLQRLVAVIEQLPPRRREVFLLFRAYGHTRTEIAERLGITEMAVAKHMVRATVDCSRVFAELRASLIEHQSPSGRAGFEARLAEDFS